MIGPTAAVALLVLFLVGILSMLLDILIRAIAIARIRGCRWWLMGAFWGTLFQVAVAPVQWAMAKGGSHLPDDCRGCATRDGGRRG